MLFLFTDYVMAQRNRIAFTQLPFSNGFHDSSLSSKVEMAQDHSGFQKQGLHVEAFTTSLSNDAGMDMNENKAPSQNPEPTFQAKMNQSVFSGEERVTMDGSQSHADMNQNTRQEPFNCLKFKESPVKCQSYFMSHYI